MLGPVPLWRQGLTCASDEDPVMLAVGLPWGWVVGMRCATLALSPAMSCTYLVAAPRCVPSAVPSLGAGVVTKCSRGLRSHSLVQRLCTAVLLEMHRGPFLIFVASVEVGSWLGPVCIGCNRFAEGLDSSAGETRLTTV